MLRVVGPAIVLAGCDLAFGIQHVGDPPDAAPPMVHGHYHQLYVSNDATFAPVLGEKVYPLGTIAFAAILDDGTRVPVDYQEQDGSFSFALAHEGQAYRFVFTVDGVRSETQASTSTLKLAAMVAGRPDRVPIAVAGVTFSYPMSTGNNYPAYLASTGLYTFTYTGMYDPQVTFDWRQATTANGGVLGMLDASQHDRIYAIEFVNDSTTIPGNMFQTINAVSSAQVTLTPNFTAMIPGPSVVGRNSCVRFSAPNVAEIGRIMTATPLSYASLTANWTVYSAPLPDRLGIVGAEYVAITNYSPVIDIDTQLPIHDPFVGTSLLVATSASANRTVQLPGATASLTLPYITTRYQKAERGTPAACNLAARTVLDAHVGLAGNFKLDGFPLDADGKQIPVDLTKPEVVVSWSIVAPGPIHTYSIGVHEITAVNGPTILIPKLGFAVIGATSARIDSSYFTPGKKYVVSMTTGLSRPGVEQGDLETLALPFENATSWSLYFEVK